MEKRQAVQKAVLRITDDGDTRDVNEIHAILKEYNLSRREPSKNVPIGVFFEEEKGQEACGIDGRDLWKLAVHPIPFCQRSAQRPGNRKQAAGGCGERSQTARLPLCFCGHLLLSSA